MKTNTLMWILFLLISLIGAPLLPGIINKTKAFFAGRHGASVFQLYRDLAKLLRKGAVFSTVSGGMLMIAPCASLALLLLAAALLPHGGFASPLAMTGDFVIFFYLLGTLRLFTVLAARDAGSSFEDMGASREVHFSALVELVIFGLISLLFFSTGKTAMPEIFAENSDTYGVSHLLVGIAFFVVLLAENCRVPVDDPETHLELTMIHEAMILDYSGADLGLIHYGAALKMWLFSTLFVLLVLPIELAQNPFILIGGILLTAVAVGAVESSMARFRFLKVPHFLLAALGILLLGFFFRGFFESGVFSTL